MYRAFKYREGSFLLTAEILLKHSQNKKRASKCLQRLDVPCYNKYRTPKGQMGFVGGPFQIYLIMYIIPFKPIIRL